ncbi:hypothetical protein [Sharpea porci]|uniref:hypothetical protein n=1 Tax=Sharpea porci TaxID=2652286 RepID=UPI002A90ADE1|nr:hypothetical protein [Sharpea porci]MDY5278887.1 hypothetical protein [Sharpea porci]
MDNVMSLFVSLLALIGILLVMQIITVEIMARKALKTNNTGYFMIFNLPYSYNRSARMGFVYFFVYLLFFSEKVFSTEWFLYLLVFIAMGIVSDAVVQYLVLYYGKIRFKKYIVETEKLEDEVKAYFSQEEAASEDYERSMPTYNEIELTKKYLQPTDHLAFMSIDGGDYVKSFQTYPEVTFDVEPFFDQYQVEQNLSGLPIKVTGLTQEKGLPFKDNHIDLFANEYSTYDKNEVVRVLKPGGIFVLNQNGSENLKEFLNMYMPLALRSQWNVETAKQSLINVGFTILEAYEDYGYLHFRSLSQLDTYLKKVVPELTKEREKFVTFYTQALRDIKNQGFYSLSTYRFIIIAKLTGSYQEIAQEHQS